MEGLAQAYPQVYADDFNLFEVLAVEKKIAGPIVNPESGRASRDYAFAGKIDALVQMKTDHLRPGAHPLRRGLAPDGDEFLSGLLPRLRQDSP